MRNKAIRAEFKEDISDVLRGQAAKWARQAGDNKDLGDRLKVTEELLVKVWAVPTAALCIGAILTLVLKLDKISDVLTFLG